MADEVLVLHLDGFEGPMDLLLELARGQKLDLSRISILSLVEQYLAIIERARIRLDLAADWLVMAAWLAWLKSRLLLPPGTDAAEEGEEAAEVLTARLHALQAVRELAAWLGARPQLGHDVFGRGAPERLVDVDRSGLAADLPGLLRGYTAARRRAVATSPYQPRRAPLWSVQEALALLGRMLGRTRQWTALDQFLSTLPRDPVQRRAAVASTLLAGLELARTGRADLRQDEQFGPILMRATS
ncbi:MAG: ScpA family protein [Acetobacteraceae bacterium]